jgi:hypothetical protein
MDLQHFSAHLDSNIKNSFILDLILKNETLAMEAFQIFTANYSFAKCSELVNSFYHEFDSNDEKKNISHHPSVKKFRHEIDTLYLNVIQKELEQGYFQDVIAELQKRFYNFEADTFNALIEMTESIKNATDKRKIEWLNAVTESRANYATVHPRIDSFQAKQILIQYINKLQNNSFVNLLVNTDMINWFNLENSVTQRETKEILPHYYYSKPKTKISLKMATLLEIVESHNDLDIKQKVLTHIYHQCSEDDIQKLSLFLERTPQLLTNQKNLIDIELIQQYFPFSQSREFIASLSDFYELTEMIEKNPDIIDYVFSDSRINFKELDILSLRHSQDESSFIDLLDSLYNDHFFDDIEKLTTVLKFTHLVQRPQSDSEIISSLIEYFHEAREELISESSYMSGQDIDNIQIQLEKMLLDSKLKPELSKNNQKIKI